MIEHAVILAAGMGTRLGALTKQTPKALVRVAGVPLIIRLVDQMAAAGIKTLTVVTGYRGEQIRQTLGQKRLGIAIRYYNAPDYKTTNNIASLSVVPKFTAPVALSDCDVFLSGLPKSWLRLNTAPLIVPARAIQPHEAGTVVRDDPNGTHLHVLSKASCATPYDLKSVSLYLLTSADLATQLSDATQSAVRRGNTQIYYENALETLTQKKGQVQAINIDGEGLTGFEIDTPDDLKAAEKWAAAQSNQSLFLEKSI